MVMRESPMKTKLHFDDNYSNRDKNFFRDVISFYQELTSFEKIHGTMYVLFTTDIPHDNMSESGNNITRLGATVNLNDYRYVVYINSEIDVDDQIQTVFHELCHVMQFATGKQKIDHLGRTIWNNAVPYPSAKSVSFDTYLCFPWETEAREHEEKYFKLWKEQENKRKPSIKSFCSNLMTTLFG